MPQLSLYQLSLGIIPISLWYIYQYCGVREFLSSSEDPVCGDQYPFSTASSSKSPSSGSTSPKPHSTSRHHSRSRSRSRSRNSQKPPRSPSPSSIRKNNNTSDKDLLLKQQQQQSSAITYDMFITFGDSITQYGHNTNNRGYVAQLSHLYSRKLDIVQRGFSGYNTDWAKHIFPQLLQPYITSSSSSSPHHPPASRNTPRIRIISIFFGANDAAFETHPQHVPVSRYIQNIQQMVNLITNPESQYYIPEVKILLISPPPVGDKLWIKHCCIDKNPNDHKNNHPSVNDNNIQIYNRSNGHVLKYVEALEEFSQLYNPSNNNNNNSSSSSSSSDGEKRVCFVNVWKSIMTEHKKLPEDLRNNQWDGFDQFTVDGLHLSQHGYQVVVDEILKVIGQNWPELVPENLPLHAPYWKDIVDSTKFNDEDHSCEKLLVI